jgi:hypothetical protein
MVALIEKVKEHARLKHLQAAVEDFLNLIEDVSVFAIAYESKGAFGTRCVTAMWEGCI